MWMKLATCLMLSVFLGCAIIAPHAHRRALEDAQRSYTQKVRWGEFEEASQYVDPEVRDRFLAEVNRFEDLRITDYRIGPLDVADGSDAATVRVSYRAYHLATLLEGHFDETQAWHWDGDSGAWWVRPALDSTREHLVRPARP
jgi:hypothetical protein